MVVLRATQKVLRSLPRAADDPEESDTALGDGYVNRVVIHRRPLLLIVSSKTLPFDTGARPTSEDAARTSRCARRASPTGYGAKEDIVAAEVRAMVPVVVGRTIDRSVMGQLIDFTRSLLYRLPDDEWDEATLHAAEDLLARTPCGTSGRVRGRHLSEGCYGAGAGAEMSARRAGRAAAPRMTRNVALPERQ